MSMIIKILRKIRREVSLFLVGAYNTPEEWCKGSIEKK